MQINRHTVGTNVASLGTITNEERFEDIANHFHHFIGKKFEEDNHFIETHDDGEPSKLFDIHTSIGVPSFIQMKGKNKKDIMDKIELIQEMGVKHVHIMLELHGGQTVIPMVTNNTFELDPDTSIEEAYEDE
ncbi:hypothetical protein P9C27_20490 [Bacillus vallismortis]|uniref:hypothetical protein n=1 Tax=Bacillus vallismortis TaxID=72361 RepID=UPI00227DCFF8|nr:hypothetical protein [Bacillus vallismortis]MCY8110976.1 hypothetical protein [Bacillus spizizenii]MEC1270830.1 hypothetical protein [Bacillus vallismortis]